MNRWWLPHQWLRVALAMGRMLRELIQHPELGFLGGESWFGRTTIMVSYWRSIDQLMAYAKSRTTEHLPAWRSFNRLVGTGGDVGIWHEYVNMMPFGLGLVGQRLDAEGARAAAISRMEDGRGPMPPMAPTE